MKVGIYGLGRFGRFWGGLLSEKFDVIGYNRTPLEKAPGEISLASEAEVLKAEAVFLCVAISSMEPVLRRISPMIGPGTVVFDTCSVKSYPVKAMERLLPQEAEIIATHPMFGPDSGRAGVMGLPMVYSPVRCRRESAEFWKETFLNFGLYLLEMTPEEHDREAAMTQGITHLIGRVLQGMHLEESRIATLGYRKLLEIVEQTCNDPPRLFIDLQTYNPYTREMRRRLSESLSGVNTMLELDTGESGMYDDPKSREHQREESKDRSGGNSE